MTLQLDPGKAALGNPALVDAIVAEMDGGAVPFGRFMDMALYHPEHGYYSRPGRIGPRGDFVTSPTVHPMFGWVVGAWAREVWSRVGRPPTFTIIEPGAGQGGLAAAILDWAAGQADGFANALRYVAVEPHSPGSDQRVDWRRAPIDGAEAGVVVANELFDALPVRLFEATPRGPVEIYVAWDGQRFVEVAGPVATIDGAPAEGRFEVTPGAYPLMRELCSLVERGALLTFDYGYSRDELWAPWRKGGTLLAFYRHTAHEDPYIHVGEQDLTHHVDFSELSVATEDAGMDVAGPITQAAFLRRCGAAGLVEAARADMSEYFARRRALETLTDSAGLGRIRVLAASRSVEGVLPGFEGEGQ